MLVDEIQASVDELITEDGEPYEDGMAIIQHTVDRMWSAPGGMSVNERDDTLALKFFLKDKLMWGLPA